MSGIYLTTCLCSLGYPGQQPAYYPQAPQYGGYPQGMQPAYGGYMHPQIPPGSHVVGHGQFDAGARFNSGAGMNIPVSA